MSKSQPLCFLLYRAEVFGLGFEGCIGVYQVGNNGRELQAEGVAQTSMEE